MLLRKRQKRELLDGERNRRESTMCESVIIITLCWSMRLIYAVWKMLERVEQGYFHNFFNTV